MRILLFGKLAERAAREVEHEIGADGCTVGELRRSLAAAFPEIADILAQPSTRACIDQTMASEASQVLPRHEVAFLPPLSGG